MLEYQPITLGDIFRARKRIRPYIRRTSMMEDQQLSIVVESHVMLKLENQQVSGSFKPRGAANRLLTLSSEERERGVAAVSTGNHGKAVAAMARELGVPAVVCISEGVPEYKREAIRRQGAELVVYGATYDQAMERMLILGEERGLTIIRSFEDPLVTAGHATIGLELLEEMPDVDTVLIPLAAGGLLIGIAIAVKAANPQTRVYGVAMERGSLLAQSLIAGEIVDFVEQPTLADALMGGLGPRPEWIFNAVRNYCDGAFLISEDDIGQAMGYALANHHQVVEGAGAVGIAALLAHKVEDLGKHTAVIVTGGNVDFSTLLEVAQQYHSA